jgi:hypothetical protein
VRIATGEKTEGLPDSAKSAAVELGARGGKARAAKVTPENQGLRHTGRSQRAGGEAMDYCVNAHSQHGKWDFRMMRRVGDIAAVINAVAS